MSFLPIATLTALTVITPTVFAVFKGHNCNLSKIAIGVALCTSVIGIATAFFTNSLLGGIGFALFGIAASLLYASHSSSEERLRRMVLQVNQEGNQLKQLKNQAEELAGKLERQGASLNQNRTVLEIQVDKFQEENRKWLEMQKNWEHQREAMDRENRKLAENKSALETELNTLKATATEFQNQIDQLLLQNIEMGKNIGAFQNAASKLHGKEEQFKTSIQAISGKVDQSLAKLSNQVAIGKELETGIVQFLSEQQKNFQESLSDLEKARSEVRAADASLKERIAALEQNWQKYNEESSRLRETNDQLAKRETELTLNLAAFKEQNQALEEKRIKITAETERLEGLRKWIEENKKNAKAAAVEFNKTFELKQKELALLDAKILEKTAKLMDLMTPRNKQSKN